MAKSFFEMLSAKKYYGKHATGWVLLRNGCVVFHGSKKDVTALFKKYS